MEFDNLDDLRVLLATADTGSLTAAGRRCGLSTAAVSAAMKRLETALGARLFDRTTRSIRPTAEGEVMVDHARRALDLIAEGQAKLRGERGELAGTIHVTASSAMAQRLLAGWLGEFAALHPRLEIDLQVSDSWLDLVKDGVDLALRNGPLPDSSFAARLLAPAHRQAFASPEFLERHGTPAQPADLSALDCIIGRLRGRRLDRWRFTPRDGDHEAFDVPVHGRLACDNAAVALQWARQGRGVVYLSEVDLHEPVQRGEMQRLFADFDGEPAPLYAVLPSHRFTPHRVKVLVDALAAWFASR
ncbi:LysR family transcriptional regulator [Aquincola sp. S2]|uniref:LysR family transcriptional regulator n=1 Tax=Pseudaquabacterium terrae TaxID=2732868 RepID=A0ABX2EAS5_9BURK|nr:LysR family transcriptional regulator [Aquabacterium terrae]NRF65963.1 LysR family transcriptional regulator [Aquabacterium terrae]